MANISYDISILNRLREMDVENAIRNFSNRQVFFDRLSDFVRDSGSYMAGYDPETIFYDDDARKRLIAEIKTLRVLFSSLGLMSALADLAHFENALLNRDTAVFARVLSSFNLRMNGIAEHIASARIVEVDSPRAKPIVLAVDDKPALLASVAEMLSEKYKVMTMTSGLAAVKAIERHTPQLFLLDIEMPVMDGYVLASLIRKDKRFSQTPIIFLTAKGAREDVLMALKHGGNDYIVKPVDKTKLLEKVQRFLAAR